MPLSYVPLLQLQRDLYKMPRGIERFNAYIKEMVDPTSGDMRLPLSAMNPMAKEHIPALLDQYIAQNSDQLAAAAISDLDIKFGQPFKLCLVLADDAHGQWTNRYDVEFKHCFETRTYQRRGWLTGVLWSSDVASAENAALQARRTAHRGLYVEKHGYATTLANMLQQEGFALSRAGCVQPCLDTDDIGYSREIITPLLSSEHYPIQFAALFGDEAARSLGYEPLGLTSRAGFALALHDAKLAPSFRPLDN